MSAAASPSGPPAERWKRRPLGRTLARQAQRLVPIGALQRLVPRPVVGLCYHVVSDAALPHVEFLYRFKTPEQFESDLRFLKRRFRVIGAGEIEGALRERSGRPAAVITFDDGMAECFTEVRPLLLRHGLPAIFFVTPEVLDNRRLFPHDRASLCLAALHRLSPPERRAPLDAAGEILGRRFDSADALGEWLTRWMRTLDAAGDRRLDEVCAALGVDPAEHLRRHRPYLTVEQVRRLAADGFDVGAHALRHLALGALGDPAEVERQVVGSCREVARMVGAERVPFAFPFDADGVDRAQLAALRERHPEVGLLFDTRRLRRDRDFIVNRMIVDAPPALGRGGSNLPTYLRGAYWEELLGSRGTDG